VQQTRVSGHDDRHNNGECEARTDFHRHVVNFTNRTIQGFGYPGFSGLFDFPVKITGTNEVTVAFHGSNQTGGSITGSIDRVTGDVEARTQTSPVIILATR
jgi:hypothetical protein